MAFRHSKRSSFESRFSVNRSCLTLQQGIYRDLWSGFVVRRDWNFAKSGKPAAIFQKVYKSEDPEKKIVTDPRQCELTFDP
jgi:hypothetical protein